MILNVLPLFILYNTPQATAFYVEQFGGKLVEKQSSRFAATAIVVDHESVLAANIRHRINDFINKRAEARWNNDYEKADKIRKEIESIKLPDQFQISIQDIPRSEGGGSMWSLLYEITPTSSNEEQQLNNVLNLAHSALGMVVSYSDRGLTAPTALLEQNVQTAKGLLKKWKRVDETIRVPNSTVNFGMTVISLDKLKSLDKESVNCWNMIESGLTGRKAADAAFWYAVAGVTDNELFTLLTQVCSKELERFGNRPSCRIKDILSIVERLSGAGIKNDPKLEQVVRRCLDAKGAGNMFDSDVLLLNLHSKYCALMLWNFSTRQKKQKVFLETAARHWASSTLDDEESRLLDHAETNIYYDWAAMYEDPSRPLVIDVGCGMGVSLLGLASSQIKPWCEFNYLGVDLSAVTNSYANSVATRWNIDNKVAFVKESAEKLLQVSKSYPAEIAKILIQFPTPYRLPMDVNDNFGKDSTSSGNTQLPKTAHDGFMVSHFLLERCYDLLNQTQGELLIQSNCEDVALWMRTIAEQVGFTSIVRKDDEVSEVSSKPTQRTLNWAAMGGERAVGCGWRATPLLPPEGRTETEIACIIKEIPVHRCVLTIGNHER